MTWKILSYKLRGLNAMNNLGLLRTWTTLGCVPRALDAMNRLKAMDDMCHSRSWAQGYGFFERLSSVNDMNDLISCELRPLDAISSLGLWMIWMILCHELRVVDDMNDSELWAHDSRYYEQLKVVVDMNDFGSWAKGSGCSEQLRVIDDMNDLGSRELRPQDTMKNLELWIIWMILGHELMAIISTNSSGFWII